MNNLLFKRIDNTSLIVFRICFGLLCFLEAAGAVVTGWVQRTLVDPKFTFSFIGFEWLQPLPGHWMYVYYIIMSIFGLFIMVGYKYRFSAFMFAVMWTSTYLMQKSSYNNHYYLLFILSFIMVLMPAHHYASIDSKLNPKIKQISMPNWCRLFFILQLLILYTYAALAKLYPDWLSTSVMGLLMQGKANYPVIGALLQQKWMHYFLTYGGILFDGLIIPLLLFKPTRKIAFFSSIFFHLFNSIVFQIGIFPYLSIAFCVFFFEPKTIQQLFLKKKPIYKGSEVKVPKYHRFFITVFWVYFMVHLALPLRHYFYDDDVLWTEEGHRLSWRMMLRAKNGFATYRVIDKATNKAIAINLDSYLSKKQKRNASTKPDIIWQFAQYLKKEFAKQGKDVAVYVTTYVSINGKPMKKLIDPSVNLADEPWDHFRHHYWILPSK